jgi:hypothetical protein
MPKEISKANLDAALDKLKGLPKKEKQTFTLREAVQQMSGEISKLLDRGYTYKEVSTILKEQGIEIAPATLKQYVSEAKQKRSGSGRKPREKTPALGNEKKERLSVSSLDSEALSRAQVKALPIPEHPQVGQLYYVIGKTADKLCRLERVEGEKGVFVIPESPEKVPISMPLSEIRVVTDEAKT